MICLTSRNFLSFQIKEDELREFKEQMGTVRAGYGSESLYGDSAMPPQGGGFDYSSEAYPRYRGGQQKSCKSLSLLHNFQPSEGSIQPCPHFQRPLVPPQPCLHQHPFLHRNHLLLPHLAMLQKP